MHRTGLVLTLALVAFAAGCTPLVVGGVVVLADEVVEQEQGGDGLF